MVGPDQPWQTLPSGWEWERESPALALYPQSTPNPTAAPRPASPPLLSQDIGYATKPNGRGCFAWVKKDITWLTRQQSIHNGWPERTLKWVYVGSLCWTLPGLLIRSLEVD